MKRILINLLMVAVCAGIVWAAVPEKNERQPQQKTLGGYPSTPSYPDSKWRVHDVNRPQPEVAEPKYDGTIVPVPGNGKVLFDGKNLDNFTNTSWKIEDNCMVVGRKSQLSKEKFGDIHLHLEWMVPVNKKQTAWSQGRGNSGVFMMNRYEIQILDCWANRTYPDGMTGALYGQQPPLVNACRKPGEWQCYDIHFKAPVFDGSKLVSPAKVTVYLNNVLIHDKAEFRGPTVWKKLASYRPHESKDVISLQSHKNKVYFRNIWVAPLSEDGL